MEVAAIILALGGAVLLAVAWPRWWRERKRLFPRERQWECAAIDTTLIAHRLERVRADFASKLHLVPAGRLFREQLLCAARCAVTHLSFFRRRQREPDNDLREHPIA